MGIRQATTSEAKGVQLPRWVLSHPGDNQPGWQHIAKERQGMTSNIGHEKIISHRRHKDGLSATRWATNHDWNFRGDNTKYKTKK